MMFDFLRPVASANLTTDFSGSGHSSGEIASILDGIPLSVQRRFPELENRHVDFLKRDIIKAMNKAAALDELIPGLLSEYIEQSG
ncbi:terminase small subunit [Escherichia coli]|nr:terminase small subunit [Escherichia coli]